MNIVRVELFEENDKKADYDHLHGILARNGFYRTVQDDLGDYYWLPPATYIFYRNAETATLLARVDRIVKSYWPDSSVLVVPCSEAHWIGLNVASKGDRDAERQQRLRQMVRAPRM